MSARSAAQRRYNTARAIRRRAALSDAIGISGYYDECHWRWFGELLYCDRHFHTSGRRPGYTRRGTLRTSGALNFHKEISKRYDRIRTRKDARSIIVDALAEDEVVPTPSYVGRRMNRRVTNPHWWN